MKLNDYAEKNNLTYTTAYRHFKKGLISGAYQLDSGTIIVPEETQTITFSGTQDQISGVINFCNSQGWNMTECNNVVYKLGGQ